MRSRLGTFITTLDNGIRVASTCDPCHFMSVGVYVAAGSRFENNQTTGCTHLMDRLAFKVILNY
jgi:processing peptidase subunit alpha